MAATLDWSRKRSAVWAADLPYFLPIWFKTGLLKMSLRPSAKGPQFLSDYSQRAEEARRQVAAAYTTF